MLKHSQNDIWWEYSPQLEVDASFYSKFFEVIMSQYFNTQSE